MNNPLAPLQLLLNILPWLIPLILALNGLSFLFKSRIRGMAGEAAVARVLDHSAEEVVNDIVLTDRRGRRTQIDHVARLPGGLLVVETKNYSGLVFGQARDRKWTQRLGRTSHTFLNPLIQNKQHIEAVERAAPGVPVAGRVVFTDRARFPKGRPEGVSSLSTLAADITGLLPRAHGNLLLEDAWCVLTDPERAGASEKRAHLRELRERRGPDKQARAGWVMLAAAGIFALLLSGANGPTEPASSGTVSKQPADPVPLVVAANKSNRWHRPPSAADTAPPKRPNSPVHGTAVARHRVQPAVELVWNMGHTKESQECVLARATMLVHASVENARRRDSICGPGPAR